MDKQVPENHAKAQNKGAPDLPLESSVRQAQELSLIYRLQRTLTQATSLQSIFWAVIEGLHDTFGYDLISICRVEGGHFTEEVHIGYEGKLTDMPLEDGIMARTARTERAMFLEDVTLDPSFIETLPGIRSEICVPLFEESRLFGVLNVETITRALTEADFRLLQVIGEQLGFVLERYSLHAQLEAREERYRLLVETVQEIIFETDARGNWSFLNAAWTDFTGYPIETSLGKSFEEVIHPEDRLEGRVRFRHVLHGKQDSLRHDLRYLTASGETRWAEVHAQRLELKGVPGLLGTIRDTTKRKVAEEALRESEARYSLLFQRSPVGLCHYTTALVINACNDAFVNFLQSDYERLLGLDMYRLKDQRVIPALEAPLAGERGFYEGQYQATTSSARIWILLRTAPLLSPQGEVMSAMGTIEDVTERKNAEVALRTQEANFRAILEHSQDAFILCDENLWVQAFNRVAGERALRAFGRPLQKGLPLEGFVHPHDLPLFRDLTARALQGESTRAERNIHTTSGDGYWVEISYNPVWANNKTIGLVFASHDITERKRYEAQVEQMAFYDALTGLPNRRLLQERAEHALREAELKGERLLLLYLDLDRFKTINDTLGHEAGDSLLQAIANALAAAVVPGTTVARLGGDEFSFLVPDAAREDAVTLARELIAVISRGYRIGTHDLHVGGSLGIALYPDHGKTLAELLKHADIAMYTAKAVGGGYSFYDPRHSPYTVERLELETALRHAVLQEALVLHFQPIVRLKDGQVGDVEALARWPREGGLVFAQAFIPLAEESDLIRLLDMLTLKKAVEAARNWHAAGRDLRVSVNLSARSLHDDELLSYVETLLQVNRLPPKRLIIELTETVAIKHPEAAERVLRALQSLGLGLAIDDFGSGYASLTYLRRFPAQRLKLDRSLTQGIGNPQDEVLLQAAIALGHGLGLEVVAEGVETEAQRRWLEQHRCDYAQGFLIGRPVSGEKV